MSKIDDGGQAFPVSNLGEHGAYGMSMLDWFAGMAIQAYLHNIPADATYDDLAEKAYRVADAMLAARKVRP